tara:strand:- start:464 stop:847 length:384 start_codon:yes stop_codon:yes gene_type:complete
MTKSEKEKIINETVESYLELVKPKLQALEFGEYAKEYSIPDDDLVRESIKGCIVVRAGQGYWRKSKPKTEPSALLWQFVKFHNSTGSLYGYPWFHEKELGEKLDTLAVLLLGGKSNAANNWQRAIYG